VEEADDLGIGIGTLALVNAGLAQGKQRSALNWFFASLFLGPIATFLIVYLQPPATRTPEPGPPPT
jgi:hypothetical protein